MHQIYIAAIIASLLSLLFWGNNYFSKDAKAKNKSKFKLYVLLMILQLPVSYAAFEYFRIPILDEFVKSIIDPEAQKTFYEFITVLYAPITEELAKLWPLLIPFVAKAITPKNAYKAGLALGLGFGIGEIWTIANFVAQAPENAAYAWYEFSGFMGERFIVVIMHGAITAIAVHYLYKHKKAVGILYAMILHLLLNFPILLAQWDLFSFGKLIWFSIINIWLILFFVGSIVALKKMKNKDLTIKDALISKAKCPSCTKIYKRPIFAVNIGIDKRYEPCSHCRKWHLTNSLDSHK